ncbi:ATP-binding cassette domain-containing protein [Lysobacter sp. TY2-98]|uniref:ATP-binding cassette domain-containing protein n=1 Tax=Lysobacter sp. TY2-98 TaxID=2290922 RepID=UPI000E20219E|nr:ATP-binding cassette domain-containing protein [Lysobacter sp. TY2-98]AXK73642.1 ATP-binding cassette domain-containing protein [Lysobacter sp. TY2-98]
MHRIDVRLRRGGFERRIRVESASRVVAVVGASGSGKTSLLHAAAGLVRPVEGRIEIAGDVLFDSAHRIDVPAHRRRIGYVFQDGRLFPHLAVRANLLYGAAHAPRPTGTHFDDVVELLALEPLLARRTAGLSGGEIQRIALGRALLAQPRLLLLDEPLSMLDPDRRDELLPYLQRVRDESGLPMIYVSHVPAEVARIAQDVHRIDAI